MARNRKRAKERRARRPDNAAVSARGRAGAPGGRLEGDGAPDPIEHATPDTELAEAHLVAGRPEVGAGVPLGREAEPAAVDPEPEFDAEPPPPTFGGPGLAAGPEAADEDGDAETGEAGSRLPAERAHPGSRLVHFLQGSWRELQRVQWPDRRQVMQATGVVIGFVIVAGAFLGVADFLAGKLMDLVLK